MLKIRFLLLIIILIFAFGCSPGVSSPIVGKWKLSRQYDQSQKDWKSSSEDILIEFLVDGTLKASSSEETSTLGKYEIIESEDPKRIVWTVENQSKSNGIFRLEGNKLVIKMRTQASEAQFPTDFEPGKDVDASLIELERQ